MSAAKWLNFLNVKIMYKFDDIALKTPRLERERERLELFNINLLLKTSLFFKEQKNLTSRDE